MRAGVGETGAEGGGCQCQPQGQGGCRWLAGAMRKLLAPFRKKKKKKQSAVEVGFSGLSKQVRRLGTLGGTSAHGGPQLLSESSKARPVRAADRGQSLRLPRGSPVTV